MPTAPSRPTSRLSTSRSSSTGTANDTRVDRLEVRRKQFEIRAAEPLEKIVLGPTGHMCCSGRESAPARTLRFRDGADGSKVHTRRFRALKKRPAVCGVTEIAGEAHITRG